MTKTICVQEYVVHCKSFFLKKILFMFSDPHIKVAGMKEAVAAAKDKILTVLDTKVCMIDVLASVKYVLNIGVVYDLISQNAYV